VPRPTRAHAAGDAASDRVDAAKSADNTPSAKPKSRAGRSQAKVRKAQGALRNIDF
jgi:hypothetical protein